MKRNLTSMLVLLVSVFSILSLNSCKEDNPSTSPLVGTWASYCDQSGNTINSEDHSYKIYTFNPDGNGYIEYWDKSGKWKKCSVSWDPYNGNEVNIYRFDEDPFIRMFFKFQKGDLVLTTDNYKSYILLRKQ